MTLENRHLFVQTDAVGFPWPVRVRGHLTQAVGRKRTSGVSVMSNGQGKKPTFKPRNLDRDDAIDEEPPKYLWCLHCERAYVRGAYRLINRLQMCPYEDCSGDTVIDAWDWNFVREKNPTYPENPIRAHFYPLYGSAK